MWTSVKRSSVFFVTVVLGVITISRNCHGFLSLSTRQALHRLTCHNKEEQKQHHQQQQRQRRRQQYGISSPSTISALFSYSVSSGSSAQWEQRLSLRSKQQQQRRPPQRRRLQSSSLNALGRHTPENMDVIFGSANMPAGSVSYGDVDLNDDGSYGRSDNDGSVDGGTVDDLHSKRVQELMQISDDEFRQARKVSQWGEFASATNKKQVKAILEKQVQAIQQENALKAKMATAMGVDFTVLEPREEFYNGNKDSGSSSVFDGNVKISAGSSQKASSWFSEMDQELRDEWRALNMGRDGANGPTTEDGNLDDDGNIDHDDSKGIASADADAHVHVDETSGKIIPREALAGIRVGSVGGWSLEVFPGDFVVHRKYGIGRFDRTCLRPKTKLTPAQVAARDERRAEILTQELRKLQDSKQQKKKKGTVLRNNNGGKKGSGSAAISTGVTPDEIQAIRSKFGTEEDSDPVSNPQTTVLEISYADAVVHVPVDRAYRLSRYRAGDAVVKPKLSRARSEAWATAKRKAEETTIELAQDVLALYATRETLHRPPFNPAMESKVKQFETTFPFTPTVDQVKCFEDVENDMVWRSRPMDRLVCGDVGFGKTEVAIRALYRAVSNGRQAALLAPTGVLASQHYKNIIKRMGPDTPYNVNITLLRRGTSKTTKAGQALRKEIASGTINLIVGTHALLSNDIKYKDLGLLVVDEEQRFGVRQKERLKLICNGIDVLTLSATPIPRTLQMSLSGIRDTSTIRSPPPMRKPTVSYVQDFSEDIVYQGISTELERGGQCFYVVPRISLLDEAQAIMEKMFPNIRIIQAHGRMQRNGAEDNVAEFAEGNYDVLLATTVIENGVDIPSVNTIIIQDSQFFGMSTLYQLRGRVGRSDKQAYAYFLHRSESLTETAAMRLQAIGDLSEIGSGFDVANRDLEIRGAGSLLGTEQSGLAAKVGFDLYMRMLKKSIRKLRGLDLPLVPRTNVLISTEGSPDTFTIPKKFIPHDQERHTQESLARLAESTATLVNLTSAWKDTYGNLPAGLQAQLKTMHLHTCTRRLGIDLVGLVDSGYEDDEGKPEMDLVLRSPGLRPRHWATIVKLLPKGIPPKGLDVVFPPRFSSSGDEMEIRGGKRINLKELLMDETLSEEQEDEEWDSMDQEEIEAMKDISSAVNVQNMDEIDNEQYPRFVVRNFGPFIQDPRGVDHLLKLLLPVAKVVYETQQNQAEEAKARAELRRKQEEVQTRRKQLETKEATNFGYRQFDQF